MVQPPAYLISFSISLELCSLGTDMASINGYQVCANPPEFRKCLCVSPVARRSGKGHAGRTQHPYSAASHKFFFLSCLFAGKTMPCPHMALLPHNNIVINTMVAGLPRYGCFELTGTRKGRNTLESPACCKCTILHTKYLLILERLIPPDAPKSSKTNLVSM